MRAQAPAAAKDALSAAAYGLPPPAQPASATEASPTRRSPARASRTGATVAAFEHEYAQIQSMIAASERSNGRRNRTSLSPSTRPSTLADQTHSDPAHVRDPGLASRDSLVAYATQLRSTIAQLIELVPSETAAVSSSAGPSASFSPAGGRETLPGTHGSYRAGGMSSSDVVDLAELRALNLAELAQSRPPPERQSARAARSHNGAAELKASPGAAWCAGQENAGAAGNGPQAVRAAAPAQQARQSQSQDTKQGKPAAQCSPLHPAPAECDARAELFIAAFRDLRVPYVAVAALESAQPLGLWLSWKLPGAAWARPWCHVGALGDQELRREPGGGFRIPSVDVAASVQVC